MASSSPQLQRAAGRPERGRQAVRRQLRRWTASRWTTCRGRCSKAVSKKQPVDGGQQVPRTTCTGSGSRCDGTPYLVGGTQGDRRRADRLHAQVAGAGAPGPQLAGLVAGDRHRPRADRLGAARAGRGDDRAAARAAAGEAARRLGEGKLDTRLRVSGTDELADLSRTFNTTAERAGEAGRRHERAGRGQPAASSPTCRTSCAPR